MQAFMAKLIHARCDRHLPQIETNKLISFIFTSGSRRLLDVTKEPDSPCTADCIVFLLRVACGGVDSGFIGVPWITLQNPSAKHDVARESLDTFIQSHLSVSKYQTAHAFYVKTNQE
jgi:hypothetical protein